MNCAHLAHLRVCARGMMCCGDDTQHTMKPALPRVLRLRRYGAPVYWRTPRKRA